MLVSRYVLLKTKIRVFQRGGAETLQLNSILSHCEWGFFFTQTSPSDWNLISPNSWLCPTACMQHQFDRSLLVRNPTSISIRKPLPPCRCLCSCVDRPRHLRSKPAHTKRAGTSSSYPLENEFWSVICSQNQGKMSCVMPSLSRTTSFESSVLSSICFTQIDIFGREGNCWVLGSSSVSHPTESKLLVFVLFVITGIVDVAWVLDLTTRVVHVFSKISVLIDHVCLWW